MKLLNRCLPWLLVGLFVALSVGSALNESLTFDEIVHAQEGVNALAKHTFLIDTNNPPLVRELAMLPMVLGAQNWMHSTIPAVKLFPARFVVILLGALTLVAVYRVTKRYFGRTQALLALFLLTLEPTFLGNSHYVTLDTGVTLFIFLAYMSFVRLMERYATQQLVLTAAFWGAAFASKMMAIPFLVVSALIAGASIFKSSFRRALGNAFLIVLFTLVGALVVWATYFFTTDVLVVSRQDSDRISSRLFAYAAAHNNKVLERIITFTEKQPLPIGNYLAVIKNTIARPTRQPSIFFLGHFYPSVRWYFMGITLFLKLPIPLTTLFILGFFTRRRRKRVALFVIPVFVIIGASSLVNIQPWIRYVLPAFPFIAIVASESLSWLKTSVQIGILLLLCLWLAAGTGLSFPHYISYANEFAGPESNRYKLFMDSNLDWGQSLPDMERYIGATKPGFLSFSYFGRDNGDVYNLRSDTVYGSHRYENICAFHYINLPNASSKIVVAISVSNWYYCGYNINPQFMNRPVKAVIGGSVLIF